MLVHHEPTMAEPLSLPLLSSAVEVRRRERNRRMIGLALVAPAVLLVAAFLYYPITFIVQMSFTLGSSYLSPQGPEYSTANYDAMFSRYLPNVLITLQLAALSTIVNLVFGFPFAYVLVRKIRYRDVVRAFMVFPMFGALYIAFGMRFILLPGGPATPLFEALGIPSTAVLYSLPSVVFAMSVFTFPFMVMNIGAALSNVDPTLEEAAACLGARPWQTFRRILLPLTRSGVIAGILMVFGWNIGTFAEPVLLGSLNEQRALAWTLYQRGVVQTDYGLSSAMSVVLLVIAFARQLLLAALLPRSARRMTANQMSAGAVTAGPPERARRVTRRRLVDLLGHAYVWFVLILFVLPFLTLLAYSVTGPGGTYAIQNFQYVLGSFGENLWWSLRVSGLTLVINLLVALPAAYAIVRYSFPGKRLLFTALTLPLYVPGAVIGISLVLVYNFTYHLTTSVWGLVLAMAVGTFPLMLTPIVVALKDLPVVFEEAAACLGATRWQAFWRIVFPLIGPGVSAGLMLSFIIVFNEYLVTLFVHPPDITTGPLRVFNLIRTAGLAPTTAALAVTMQVISFAAVLLFFRVFGTRYLKGTYLI